MLEDSSNTSSNTSSGNSSKARDPKVTKDSYVTYVTRADFDAHLKEYEEYKMEDKDRHEAILTSLEASSKATEDVVAAWVFASNFNKFLKWLASLGALGTGVIYLIDKFNK